MHATALPISTDQPMVPPRPEARGLTLPQPFNLLSEVRAPRITSFLQESAMAVASNTLGQSPI